MCGCHMSEFAYWGWCPAEGKERSRCDSRYLEAGRLGSIELALAGGGGVLLKCGWIDLVVLSFGAENREMSVEIWRLKSGRLS